MTTTRLQSKLSFRLMSLEYCLRDRRQPPREILERIGVQKGMKILDYGCGPGGFSLAAAQLVGSSGTVYAIDIHPLAIKTIQRAVLRENIGNVVATLGSDNPGVSLASIDMILLYDVLHHLPEPQPILERFHRLLKPEGVLSVRDHHMPETQLMKKVTEGRLFRMIGSGAPKSPFRFEKT